VSKIPQETLELIASANDIVEVIGSYFPLKRAGTAYKANCPFHNEKTPSFTVNPQRQIFKCFGCGAGGGVFKFVELYENLSFPEAVKKLADRAGIKIIEEQLSSEDDRRFRMRKRLLALHQEAANWFHRNLLKTQAALPARDYLKNRGISVEVAKGWKIGYAPDSWDSLVNHALELGFTPEEIVRSGLATMKEANPDMNIASEESVVSPAKYYDRFRDRVMFPICDDRNGEVIAFSGRVLSADAKGAKYVNSPETILFTKGNVLFGLHKSKRALIDKQIAIVCEGQLDLITAFESGVQNVIAPQGTAFTQKQAQILKRYVEEVVLCFDADAAGQKAAERSLAALLDANLFVRIAQMPAGHDPDSLIREQGAEAFARQITDAKDFFDYQIDRRASLPEFATPRGKMKFAKEMAVFVSLLSEAVLREAVIGKITTRLELSANDFRAMLSTPSRKEAASGEVAIEKPPKLGNTMALLCTLALRNIDTRAWLLSQPWRETLRNNPEGDLLARILEADLRVDEPGSVSVFLAKLNATDAAIVSTLLLQKPPENPETVVLDCWNAFERSEIQRRREAVTSKLRSANLSDAELQAIQREIMELKNREDLLMKQDRRAPKRNS